MNIIFIFMAFFEVLRSEYTESSVCIGLRIADFKLYPSLITFHVMGRSHPGRWGGGCHCLSRKPPGLRKSRSEDCRRSDSFLQENHTEHTEFVYEYSVFYNTRLIQMLRFKERSRGRSHHRSPMLWPKLEAENHKFLPCGKRLRSTSSRSPRRLLGHLKSSAELLNEGQTPRGVLNPRFLDGVRARG